MTNKGIVLFDGTATQGAKDAPFHGGADYAIYVLEHALNRGYNNMEIILYKNYVTNKRVLDVINAYNIKSVYAENINDIYTIANKGDYQSFFSAMPYNYVRGFKIPFIGVIHGLRSIELPLDKYKYKYEKGIRRFIFKLIGDCNIAYTFLKKRNIRNMLQTISNIDTIITVSEHSKYSLLYYFPQLNRDNLVVIPSPISLKRSDCMSDKYGKYILMVNTNRFEKNTYRAITAIDELYCKGFLSDTKVVMTGGKYIQFKNEIINKEQFVFLDYVDESELQAMYSNAFIFLYPSLNEGYGYPPLIAMVNGTPVIASSSTSIPEVCKDAALYVNPLDKSDISNRILQLYYNNHLRSQLIEKGLGLTDCIMKIQDSNTCILLQTIFGE